MSDTPEVIEELRLLEFFADVQVVTPGRYLGAEIGPQSGEVHWEAAARKYKAHVRQVAAMPLHRRGRLVACGVYALSVLRSVVHVAPLPQAALSRVRCVRSGRVCCLS